MILEFSPAPDRAAKTATTSGARLAANRRNAKRSTGPRTATGKRRSSRNALKHGLCSTRAVLPGECAAAYATFCRELEDEFQPRTPMQHSLLPHIANLMWRLDRLPQAQADMFEEELKKCRGRGKQLTAAQVLAKRFSDEPTHNGFLLINRYESSLRAQLNRLMTRYDALQRRRPFAPWPDNEPPVPDEGKQPAWDDARAEQQRALFAAREHALDHNGPPPANEDEESVDRCIQLKRELDAKRTQSKPTQIAPGDAKMKKTVSPHAPPATERTQSAAPIYVRLCRTLFPTNRKTFGTAEPTRPPHAFHELSRHSSGRKCSKASFATPAAVVS